MLKKLHPVFQFVIILVLFVAFVATAIHFHVGFLAAFFLAIEAAALGASILTHEEHVLDYNLEDLEQDELARLEAEVKAEIAKVKGAAARVEKKIAGKL
jgi:hypothetical protein